MNAPGSAAGRNDLDGAQPFAAAPDAVNVWWRWTLPADAADWGTEDQRSIGQDPSPMGATAYVVRLLAIAVPLLVVVMVA